MTGQSGQVRVRVPAKTNLYLRVGSPRPDGYHELTTIYQALSLYDEVTADAADDLVITAEGEGTGSVPLDQDNLAVRAARALAARAGVPPLVRLHLVKRIPVAAGLAGGSADAAAALVACDALWGTGLDREELGKVAAEVGSDVPFLLHGGTAIGTGRGEAVSALDVGTVSWHWVLAFAHGGLQTPEVYRTLDRLRADGGPPGAARSAPAAHAPAGEVEALLAALRQGDPAILAGRLGNDLESAALALRPELRSTLEAGLVAGAVAGFVSGSGPTCVFLAPDAAAAAAIRQALDGSGTCRASVAAVGPAPGAHFV